MTAVTVMTRTIKLILKSISKLHGYFDIITSSKIMELILL